MWLEIAHGRYEVEAELYTRLEPVDGRTRLGGRIAPHPEVAALVKSGVRDAALGGQRVRLTEIDPWGGVLLQGRLIDENSNSCY